MPRRRDETVVGSKEGFRREREGERVVVRG
jgi:hypothetical protein